MTYTFHDCRITGCEGLQERVLRYTEEETQDEDGDVVSALDENLPYLICDTHYYAISLEPEDCSYSRYPDEPTEPFITVILSC